MGILRKKNKLSNEEFRNYWKDIHSLLAKKLLGDSLKGYHQNHVINSEQLGFDHKRSNYVVDGLSQLTFNDEQSMKKFFSAETKEILLVDEAKFIGDLQLLITERNIVAPLANKPLIKKCPY